MRQNACFLPCMLRFVTSYATNLHKMLNSNSNSTFIALNLCQKTDSKAHHTKTWFYIKKPETLQGSAPRRKQKEIGNLGWVCFSKEV